MATDRVLHTGVTAFRRSVKSTGLFATLTLAFAFSGVAVAILYETLTKTPPGVADKDYISVFRTRGVEPSAYQRIPLFDYEEIRKSLPEVDWFHVQQRPTVTSVTNTLNESMDVNARMVSSQFFILLGIDPLVGHVEPDALAKYSVVISENLWISLFSESTEILGEQLRLSTGESALIVGVVPSEFRGLFRNPADVWIFSHDEGNKTPPAGVFSNEEFILWGNPAKLVLGIIKGGNAEFNALRTELAEFDFRPSYPQSLSQSEGGSESNTMFSTSFGVTTEDEVSLIRGLSVNPGFELPARESSMWLALIVFLMFCLTYVMLAEFWLYEVTSDRHSLSIRSALGATPFDLFKHTAGSYIPWLLITGIAIYFVFTYVQQLLLSMDPFSSYPGILSANSLFLGHMSYASLLMITFFIALLRVNRRLTNQSVINVMHQADAHYSLSRVGRQVVLTCACVCLIFVLSMVFYTSRYQTHDFGFKNTNVSMINVLLSGKSIDEVKRAIRTVSTVESVSNVPTFPLAEWSSNLSFSSHDYLDTSPSEPIRVQRFVIDEDFFRTLGMEAVTGSLQLERGTGDIVISRKFAETVRINLEDVAGSSITLQEIQSEAQVKAIGIRLEFPAKVYSIVGVVDDILFDTYGSSYRPLFYQLNESNFYMSYLIDHSGSSENLLEELRHVPELGGARFSYEGSPKGNLREQFFQQRSVDLFRSIASFVLLLLSLAAVSYSIVRRINAAQRSIAIRIALGGTPYTISNRYVREMMVNLSVAGILVCVTVILMYLNFPNIISVVEVWLLVPTLIMLAIFETVVVYSLVFRSASKETVYSLSNVNQ